METESTSKNKMQVDESKLVVKLMWSSAALRAPSTTKQSRGPHHLDIYRKTIDDDTTKQYHLSRSSWAWDAVRPPSYIQLNLIRLLKYRGLLQVKWKTIHHCGRKHNDMCARALRLKWLQEAENMFTRRPATLTLWT